MANEVSEMTLPIIIDLVWKILSGSLTIIVAIAVGVIAYRQHRTARDKLRMDLYDRRFEYFKGILKVIELCRYPDLESMQEAAKKVNIKEDFSEFETEHVLFLFGKDIQDFIADLNKRAVDYTFLLRKYSELVTGHPEKQKTRAEIDISVKWFLELYPNAHQLFMPYLGFQEVFESKKTPWYKHTYFKICQTIKEILEPRSTKT